MAERTTAIRGEQIRADAVANGLTKDAEFNIEVLAGIGSGVSDTINAIDVTEAGIAIRVDGSTIDANGSDQIYIPTDGVTSTELDLNDTYDFTESSGGTILVNDPVSDNDVANKAYVDAVASGLHVKEAVVAMAASNVTLANEQTIDGIALVAGDRVLCTGQSSAVENCIWVVVDSGAWTRPTDFAAGDHASGAFCFIQQGSTYADQGWVQTKDDISGEGDVIGTNDLSWTQFSAANSYTEGAGIDITGQAISLDLNTVVTSGFAVDVAADSLAFLDATDGGTKADTIADLVSGITGNGLADTAGVARVNPDIASTTTSEANAAIVGVNGVSIAVDDSTIEGSLQGGAGAETLRVKDEGITEPKLDIANAPQDGYVLTYSASGSDMLWANIDIEAVTEGDIKFEDRSAECDKVTTDFVLVDLPVDNSLQVFLNGLLQQEGVGKDYTWTSGTKTVAFADAPHNNDTLLIHYIEKDT